MFKALVISKSGDAQQCAVRDADATELPEGDVTLKVDYSTVNYKDGLAITGKAPVVRKFPMVPGFDGAGTVTASSHAQFKTGDQIILKATLERALRGIWKFTTVAEVNGEEAVSADLMVAPGDI